MGKTVTDQSSECLLKGSGNARDLRVALGLMGLVLAMFALSVLVDHLPTISAASSVKGILVLVIGPLVGGLACLTGIVGMLIAALRFRRYYPFLFFVVAFAGTVYSIGDRVQTWQELDQPISFRDYRPVQPGNPIDAGKTLGDWGPLPNRPDVQERLVALLAHG